MFVKVRDRDEQGWCGGCINGKIGLYPDNYVEIISHWLPTAEDRIVWDWYLHLLHAAILLLNTTEFNSWSLIPSLPS